MAAFFANWPWKLASLLVGLAIWVGVASEPEMTTFLRVPIQFSNAPKNLEISSDIVGTVRLELLGSSGRLREISASPPPVVLDFSGIRTPMERTLSVSPKTVRLPRGVQLVNSVPAQLRFVFENRIERDVPIVVRWSGAPASGKRVAKEETDPPKVTIIGPASRVNLVDSVSTDPLDLSSVKSGDTLMTSPYISEPQVRLRSFQPIHVRVILK